MHIHPAISGRLTRIAMGHVGASRLSGDGSAVAWAQWVNGQWDVLRARNGRVDAVSKDPRNDLDPQVSNDGDTDVYCYDDANHGQQSMAVAEPGVDEMYPSLGGDGATMAWHAIEPDGKTIAIYKFERT